MSRQRGFLLADHRKLQIFQASDSEIQADLKKLKYFKKPEPETTPAVIKSELPKKRKAPAEDNKFVIEMLTKLQTLDVQEVKKKPVKVEKKQEVVVNKQPLNSQNWMNIMAMQQQFRSFFMNPSYMFNGFQISSSADKHLKIAQFIQNHKNKSKTNSFK